MSTPIRVAVTGAAGQIGYSLVYRIANGDLFGPHQPVILHLLEVTPVLPALQGVVMELEDCAFPLLQNVVVSDDANVAFKNVNYALLVGAMPRKEGMERKDLLQANANIFGVQGKALNNNAASDLRVLVVGNPANTNCLIAQRNAPDLPAERFTAMTRLDHNRALTQIAQKAGVPVSQVRKVTIWGNHSNTQYPDAYHAEINGRNAAEVINDDKWIKESLIPTVQKRGAAIIAARKMSSAASAANAAINHVQSWHNGTPQGDWVSMAIPSDGQYDAPKGVVYGYPVTVKEGKISLVEGLRLSDFDRQMMTITSNELLEEKAAVEHLLK